MPKGQADKEKLKEMIKREMTVNYEDALERVFLKAKIYIRLLPTGKVEVLDKDRMEVYDVIRLYLIGRLYAVRAGYTDNEYVSNQELAQELSLPEGTVNSTSKKLRDAHVIHTQKEGKRSAHRVEANWVERSLDEIGRKYQGIQTI